MAGADWTRTNLFGLVEKYRREFAADEETRLQIAQQATAIAAARIARKN
jgi:hypothetical protein